MAVRTDEKIPALVHSARAGEVGIFAQFGGQGVQYIDELRNLYNTYTFTHSFIAGCTQVLEEFAANDEARILGFYRHGMNLLGWLQQTEYNNAPPEEYLSSAPVSFPLIFITQLCHYLVVAKLMFKTADPIQQLQQIIKVCSIVLCKY